ncbi:hypothetical protein Q8F55_006701 [Vanrija albida]|uniref:Uncharacterized protein n=1 Tax=Vanrija albida TaxID=181172 RepID=A0ABR3PXV1_9TREE
MKLSLILVASTLAVAAAAPAAAPEPEEELWFKPHFGHAFGVNAAANSERDSVPVERAAPEGAHMARRNLDERWGNAKWFVDPVGRHAPFPCPDKARSHLPSRWIPGPLGALLSRLGLHRPGRDSPMGYERIGGHHGAPVIIELRPEQLHGRPRPNGVNIHHVGHNAGGFQPQVQPLNKDGSGHHYGHGHHAHAHHHDGHRVHVEPYPGGHPHLVGVAHSRKPYYAGSHPQAHAALDAMLYKWDMFRVRLGKGLTDLPVPIRSFVIGALVGAVLQVLFSLIFLAIRLGCRDGSCRERRAARRAARQERRAARRAAKEAKRASKAVRDDKAAEAGFAIDEEVLPSYAEGETDRLVDTA